MLEKGPTFWRTCAKYSALAGVGGSRLVDKTYTLPSAAALGGLVRENRRVDRPLRFSVEVGWRPDSNTTPYARHASDGPLCFPFILLSTYYLVGGHSFAT